LAGLPEGGKYTRIILGVGVPVTAEASTVTVIDVEVLPTRVGADKDPPGAVPAVGVVYVTIEDLAVPKAFVATVWT
jgi:hypothetical protein